MVVAGHAGGGAAPHRLGHAEIGVLGEQEFHNCAAAQPSTVDERVLDQMVRVQQWPARSNALSAARPIAAESPAVLEIVPDLWYVTHCGGKHEVVNPGATTSQRVHGGGVPVGDGRPQRQPVLVQAVEIGASTAELLDQAALDPGAGRVHRRDQRAQWRQSTAVRVTHRVWIGAMPQQDLQDLHRVARGLPLPTGLDPVRGHVVHQGGVVPER
jgi:hypothetical protein